MRKQIPGNKKGMLGIVSYFFGLIIFLFIWAFWLGKFLNEWAALTITANGYGGILAFFLSNLNIFVFMGLILSTALVIYLGGEQ
jgi:hypothetical protein